MKKKTAWNTDLNIYFYDRGIKKNVDDLINKILKNPLLNIHNKSKLTNNR